MVNLVIESIENVLIELGDVSELESLSDAEVLTVKTTRPNRKTPAFRMSALKTAGNKNDILDQTEQTYCTFS